MASTRRPSKPRREPLRTSGRLQAAKARSLEEAVKAEKVRVHVQSCPIFDHDIPTSLQNKITKPKKFRRPKQRKSCKLLKLPGEIRNIIYRFALIRDTEITVTAKGPGEPALLKACRQIRTETRKIYYGENKFYLIIQDYDGKALVPFARQHWRATPADGTFLMRMAGLPNWNNLFAWLMEICHGSYLVPEFDDGDIECEDCGKYHRENAVKGMFKIALTLQYRLPCSTIQTVLEAAHQGLRASDARWK